MATPIIEPPYDAGDPLRQGAANGSPWNADTARRLRARRWRTSWVSGRRPQWKVLAITCILHALGAAMVWLALRPAPMATTAAAPGMHMRFVPVELLDAPPPAPPLPLPTTVVRARPHAAVASKTPVAASASDTNLTLYAPDGAPLLPAASASAPTPAYIPHRPTGDMQVMRHADPLPYRPTRLDKYFPPPDESAGGAAVRKLSQAVVKTTDISLPGGIHLKCKAVLGIPIPNCIDPPAPPSAKDGDERLSMAPAASLAPDPHALPAPSETACIAMYRAGKPLAWGCPVDTPNRAVDTELRERKAGSNPH